MTRKKLVNSVVQSERRYLWSEKGRLLAVYDGSGTLEEQYVYATGSHTPDAVVIDNTTLYRVVQDHLGSVRLVSKASDGSLAQRVDYDAWGKIDAATQVGAGFQAFGFAGDWWMATPGSCRWGARWYDPVTGRRMSGRVVSFESSARVERRDTSGSDMKKATRGPSKASLRELPEVDFSKLRRLPRGRYAHLRTGRDVHYVTIDPDLWPHFGSAAAVNAALRAVVGVVETVKSAPKHRRRARNAA